MISNNGVDSFNSTMTIQGIVYILTNPAIPNMVKIGMTSHEDVKLRMSQIYTTGVPLPFECVYAAKVANCEKIEKHCI